MAIDRTGISSLDAGAGEITYSGNEGPKSPDQQLMAQADPMVVEMYQQYVFEMEEQGLQPMSFREFMEQAMSGMADGGIARLGYASGQRVGFRVGKGAGMERTTDTGMAAFGPKDTGPSEPPGGGDPGMTFTPPPPTHTGGDGPPPKDVWNVGTPSKTFNPGLSEQRNRLYNIRQRQLKNYLEENEDREMKEKVDDWFNTEPKSTDTLNFADVSASDINRLLGTTYGTTGQQKYAPNQDIDTIRMIEGPFLNPTITDQEIRDVLNRKITEPTGIFAAEGGIARLGYKNGKMVTVPKHWQSAPDHPKTELAYITDAEKDLLLKKDLHNSLEDGPNVGPGGVMSLNGDLADMQAGVTGADISAAERGEGPRGAMSQSRADELRAGFIAAGGNQGSTKGESEGVKKEVKEIKKDSPEEQSLLERYNKWHRAKQKSYYSKNYRKALEKFVTSNMKTDLPDWYDEDEENAADKLYDWITDQDIPDYYHDLEGRDPNKLWEEYGYVPSSDTLPGIAGAFIKSKPPTLDEVEAIYDQYHKPINYTNKEPDWLEEMKVRSPNQYAIYTGTNYDPIRKTFTPREGGGGQARNLIPYPYQTASAPVDEIETTPWQAPEIPVESIRFAADGGRMGYAGGGIADLRQGYFLGKLVKKITRPIKKILKSPIGKAALLGLGGYYLGGGQLLGGSKMFGDKFGTKFALDNLMKRKGIQQLFTKKGEGTEWDPWKLGIGAASLYPLIAGMGDDDDKDFTQTDLYKKWLAQKQGWDQTFAGVGDATNWQPIRFADGGRTGYDNGGSASDRYEIKIKELMDKGLSRELAEALVLSELSSDDYKVLDKKDGGRIGYAGGGYNDDEEEDLHRTAALKAMYRTKAQEGGLMDMGGMEKDYRNEGGFVPIGGQERADDVPARLSKNEFVFTADAVRNAGGGDIDKGAEIMENLMENLEQGGKVSEDSQGLEGARNMFATSQRLEGVL